MDVKDSLELFQKYLQSQKQHITQTRLKIAAEVFKSQDHFDAHDLWRRLEEPRIAPATIYRTLDLLCRSGLVRRMELENRALYERVIGRPRHEHLVCVHCGAILEFEDPLLEDRLAEVVERFQFHRISHQVIVSGICPACQKKP
jgi:Fur family ferric uptake transcriptional regulator